MANFVSLLPMHCAWVVKSLALDSPLNSRWFKGILIAWAYEIIRNIYIYRHKWVGFHPPPTKNSKITGHLLQQFSLQMQRNMQPRNPPFQLSGTSTPNRKRASSSPCSKRLWASACGAEQKGKTFPALVKVKEKIIVFYLFFQMKEPTKDYIHYTFILDMMQQLHCPILSYHGLNRCVQNYFYQGLHIIKIESHRLHKLQSAHGTCVMKLAFEFSYCQF